MWVTIVRCCHCGWESGPNPGAVPACPRCGRGGEPPADEPPPFPGILPGWDESDEPVIVGGEP